VSHLSLRVGDCDLGLWRDHKVGSRLFLSVALMRAAQNPIIPEPPWLNCNRYFSAPVVEKAYR
jgi:hypothetical protein